MSEGNRLERDPQAKGLSKDGVFVQRVIFKEGS